MFIPHYASNKPSGFQNNKQSLQSNAQKLDKVLETFDYHKLLYGVEKNKCQTCPGCNLQTCYYMGIGPADIDCANEKCRFYKPLLKEGQKRYYTGWELPYTQEKNNEKEHRQDFDWKTGFGD